MRNKRTMTTKNCHTTYINRQTVATNISQFQIIELFRL